MLSWRKGLSSLFLLSFVATGLWGCGQQALPNRLDDDRGGMIQSGDTDPVPLRFQKDAQSNGILAANILANRINQMPGVQNTTVLLYNDDAYVGLTSIGAEVSPDARIKTEDSWKGEVPWGTQASPKSEAGMTVEELQAEGIRSNAATHDGPSTTITGNLSEPLKAQITAKVKQAFPHVKNVHITASLDKTQRLSGYKHYITRGGDMAPFMNDFLTFISKTF
jgi:hypothetical protein